MTAYPSWTPASRPGIIPLHPLGFGTVLGRSFAALRHNPGVLLGFALVVQTVGYLVIIGGVVGVAVAAFSRLATLREGTEEYDTILIGSIVLIAVSAFVLSLAVGVLGILVQAVVVQEVARGALAEKQRLRDLWRQVKPSAGRLIGYTFLVGTAVFLLLAVAAGLLLLIGLASVPLAIGLTVLLVLALIPLSLWLTTKLSLVTSALILERAPILRAVSRSWRLTRGRFWPILGVIVIISVTFSAIAQVVSIPFSFLSGGLTTVFAPTSGGANSAEDAVPALIALLVGGVLTQVVTLLIQSVAVVVQSSAYALLYIDARMRHEGLDQDLLSYVERRDAGAADLADPYLEGIGRDAAPRVPMWEGGYAPQGYAAPPPAPGGYAPPPAPEGYAPPPLPQGDPGYPPRASAVPPTPPQDDAATRWAPPGGGGPAS